MKAAVNHSHEVHALDDGHAGAAAPLATPEATGARYTCPMHPEIVRDAPGSCPKCGMALVPVTGAGEADDSELRGLNRRLWIGRALFRPEATALLDLV